MASSTAALTGQYPWISTPVILNAPMGGFAGSALACAVSKAESLGFIGAGLDMDALDSQLQEAKTALPQGQTIPVGVGLLCFIANLEKASGAIGKHKPAAVWLFAAREISDYTSWAKKLRQVSPDTKIWIQTNNVAEALELARSTSPDVLVLQGTDAGGHGHESGAGIISLLPEASDALKEAGFGHIPLVATGGIAEGRGAAAAIALGAAGVVMGTRYLAASEIILPDKGYLDALLAAKDGGQCTVRSKVFDDLNPSGNIWPIPYDGRSLKNATYADYTKGLSIEENRRLHAEASKAAGKGFDSENLRATVWAGTGVGLVERVEKAEDITRRVRDDARSILRNLSGRL